MPQVPYNPVPQEKPSGQGIPARHLDVPLGAFGGGVAQAEQGLGSQLEKTSDVIFERAYAIQKLKNDSDAKEADAKYMIQAGEIREKYLSKMGKDAVDGAPQYRQDLDDLRKSIRNGLNSDYTKKQYDSSSLYTMGHAITAGVGHAAQENRKYAIGASQARISAAGEQAFEQPDDDLAFKRGTKLVEAETRDKAPLSGWGPEQTEQAVQHNVSTMWAKRITGLARQEPFKAAKMLEDNRANMVESDFLKVDNVVRAQSRAVGSANIANEVFAAGQETVDKPAKSLAEMEVEVKQMAEKFDPKDPILANHAVAALRAQYNQANYAKNREQQTNEQTVAAGIQNGVRDVQQLRLDPKIAAAIDALPPKKQNAIPDQINRYNAAVNKVTNQDNYQRLYGLSNNNVEEFLNTDITAEQLSQQDMRKLQEVQRKMKEQPNADPRVNRAMIQIRGALGSQLESLGVYKRTDGNKEDYDRLTGAVQGALDVWQETHGKPATYKDVTETIAPQIIRQITEPGYFFGWAGSTSKVPYFKQTVPDEFVKLSKEHAASEGMPEPSPELLQKNYIRMKFMGLYGKKKESP